MPDHEVALAILERTGPLAVSSANKTGMPAATDADQAIEMLGEDVDGRGRRRTSRGGEASTIVDVTGAQGRVLRRGALDASSAQRGPRAARRHPDGRGG